MPRKAAGGREERRKVLLCGFVARFGDGVQLEEPDGWKKAVVDVLLVTFGDNGIGVDQTSKTYTIRLRGEYTTALEQGFVYTVNHPVKKPGAYQLRAAVRHSVTQKIGSATRSRSPVSPVRLELEQKYRTVAQSIDLELVN